MDQLYDALDKLPLAFHNFIRQRFRDLRSEVSLVRPLSNPLEIGLKKNGSHAWEGPFIMRDMRDICRKSHMTEACTIFGELSSQERLAMIQRKQICHFCFGHPDNQSCISESQLAFRRIHKKLLHDAL